MFGRAKLKVEIARLQYRVSVATGITARISQIAHMGGINRLAGSIGVLYRREF